MNRRGLFSSALGALVALSLFGATASAMADGPTAIANDSQGVSYVGYGTSGTIARYDSNGNPLSSWSTTSQETAAITVDPSGNIWTLDGANVYEYTPSGQLIESFNVTHCAGDSQPGNPAKYGGIAVTSTSVFVASPCFAFLARYSLNGTLQQQVNLPSQPRGVAVGPAGSKTNQVFVALPDSHEVLTYDGATLTTSSSEPPLTVDGFGSTNWDPSGVAVKNDSGGDELIVSDTLNNYLYVYDPGHLYGPNGTYSEYRTLGHGTGSAVGSVNDPTAIALHANDGSGLDSNVFIADYGNQRIQRWNDSGYTWWSAAATGPPAAGSTPTNTAPPSISGNPVVGNQVTCSTGSWNGSPSSYTYAWQDNAATISGATSASYTIQSGDAGKSLTCSVAATNGSGTSGAVTSAAVVPAATPTAPASTAPPSITGVATSGSTLTCATGTFTGTQPITDTYAWDRNGSQIATGQTYVVTDADVSQAITCVETATNGTGSASATSSAVTPTASGTAGPVGITIDNGAIYTNNPAVTLTINPPSGASQVIVSNDGSFGAPQTFPVAGNGQYNWTLATSGSERLPKTVYVRFVGNGITPYLTLTDDIILDQTAPQVNAARITADRGSSSTSGAFTLHVTAHDAVSGVGQLQYAAAKSGAHVTTLKYRKAVRVHSRRAARWVRVIDRAGNYGRWHRVV